MKSFSSFYNFSEKAGYTTRSSDLKRLKAYDENAWGDFYKKYKAMIYTVGQRQHLSDEDCKDLMQEVIRVCCLRLQNFVYDRRKGRFRSFLWRIAVNLSFNHKRKMHWDQQVPLSENLSYTSEIDQALMQEYEQFLLRQSIAEMRQTIDSETYEVFDLLVLQKRPIPEVVQITGKTPGAIYGIKHRCLKKIRQIIALFQAELENPSAQNTASEPHTRPRF